MLRETRQEQVVALTISENKVTCKSSISILSNGTLAHFYIPTSVSMNLIVVRRDITEFVDASSLPFGDIGCLPQLGHKRGVRQGILILAFHDSKAFPYQVYIDASVWVSSNCGIARIDQAEMQDPSFRIVDVGNKLPVLK